jgi:hypothetical protein
MARREWDKKESRADQKIRGQGRVDGESEGDRRM